MLIAAASNALLLLAVLACPIGMGLMMFFMGRGMMSGMNRDQGVGGDRSLAELKAEQARLAEKIETLETRPRPAPPLDAEQEAAAVSSEEEAEGVSSEQEAEGVSSEQEAEGVTSEQEAEGVTSEQEAEGVS